MYILGLANLMHIHNPVDPDLLERVVRKMVVFQQVLKVDGIDQSPFAIGVAVDPDGLLDKRQGRTGA